MAVLTDWRVLVANQCTIDRILSFSWTILLTNQLFPSQSAKMQLIGHHSCCHQTQKSVTTSFELLMTAVASLNVPVLTLPQDLDVELTEAQWRDLADVELTEA